MEFKGAAENQVTSLSPQSAFSHVPNYDTSGPDRLTKRGGVSLMMDGTSFGAFVNMTRQVLF